MIKDFSGDYAFLSNFYPSPFYSEGILYPTVEHYFQAMKTLRLGWRKQIAEACSPGVAKQMGRRVPLRSDWEDIKTSVMEEGLRLKFSNPKLREKLLSTGNESLVEGNTWHDNCWGDCNCKTCRRVVGENRLGILLMSLREEYSHNKYGKRAEIGVLDDYGRIPRELIKNALNNLKCIEE